jgi:hypothetical protein
MDGDDLWMMAMMSWRVLLRWFDGVDNDDAAAVESGDVSVRWCSNQRR